MAGTGRSVMDAHTFSRVEGPQIERSVFDRSHGIKTTFDAGYLVPFYVDEALPGDVFNLGANLFARLATPIYPVMDNMYLSTFFFAVPYRLLFENWQKMLGEQTDPGDPTSYVLPVVSTPAGGFPAGGIWDYMGIPPGIEFNVDINALPARAYNLIWNEWFRDENMVASADVPTDNGPDSNALYTLRKRGKRHDYFTSCLPWPQKGTAVLLPLGTSAPVISAGDGNPVVTASGLGTGVLSVAGSGIVGHNVAGASGQALLWSDPKLEADLSAATAATINQIREAFQIQRLYERDARGGTRYTEILRAHFGVMPPDYRLQRPEYLGGGRVTIGITPVPQTSSTDTATSSETPQGNLAGYGVGAGGAGGFTHSFSEHCIVIGLVCATADLTYQQGLDRMWTRSTRWDHFWPGLAHLGEQEVYNREIYADGSANDELVFGYNERYAEYRYKRSQITGLMRSSHPQSLDYTHLSQDFASLPALDSDFILEDPPIDRVIAVPSEPHFIMDGFMSLKCTRPIPMFGTPGGIDRF